MEDNKSDTLITRSFVHSRVFSPSSSDGGIIFDARGFAEGGGRTCSQCKWSQTRRVNSPAKACHAVRDGVGASCNAITGNEQHSTTVCTMVTSGCSQREPPNTNDRHNVSEHDFKFKV